MVMTHYMELLSLHSPWFLILFMLVPMVLAETILASGAFSLLYKDHRSEKWDSLSHICGIILGVFFIIATVYIVTSYVPTIQWRGPIDYVSIWAYVLGVIPAVLILLQELGISYRAHDSLRPVHPLGYGIRHGQSDACRLRSDSAGYADAAWQHGYEHAYGSQPDES